MLLDKNMKGDLIMENEREMFRYGPDPYFVAYTVVLLIPEIIGLGINGLNEESIFGKIPYWLLTCMVVSMLASLITGIAFVNSKNAGATVKMTPSLVVTAFMSLIYLIVGSIAFALFKTTAFPSIVLLLGFIGLTVLSAKRNNWVAFFFSMLTLVLIIISYFF